MPLNLPQKLFLDQARSDYATYRLLARRGACHRLHYLQMATEKLAKAHFWRAGASPGFSHHKFEPLLRALEVRPDFHRMFGYRSRQRFGLRRNRIFDLAARLQNLAPSGKNDGPNPEYPWPPGLPTTSPLAHTFPEWLDWNQTTAGRRLRYFVENLLENYLTYFP